MTSLQNLMHAPNPRHKSIQTSGRVLVTLVMTEDPTLIQCLVTKMENDFICMIANEQTRTNIADYVIGIFQYLEVITMIVTKE